MLTKTIQSAAKKMKIDFDEFTSGIDHMGQRGSGREEIVNNFLEKYLPEKYEIGNGIIIDNEGNQSKQQDIIIYDSFSSPVLLNMNTTKMIPIENVYAVIEIKSSLNKTQMEICVNNIKSVRDLPKSTITRNASPTLGFVFAFTSDTKLNTLLENYIELNQNKKSHEKISMICVLDKGLIINVSKNNLNQIELLPNSFSTPAMIKNDLGNNLMLFYLFLLQHLNKGFVSPPNLFHYADNEGMLDIEHMIPNKHIPEGSFCVVDGRKISMDRVISVIDDGEILKHITSGEADIEKIMYYLSKNMKDILKVSGLENPGSFEFFGKKYQYNKLKKAFDIYKNKTEVSEEELKYLNRIKKDLKEQYNKYFKNN